MTWCDERAGAMLCRSCTNGCLEFATESRVFAGGEEWTPTDLTGQDPFECKASQGHNGTTCEIVLLEPNGWRVNVSRGPDLRLEKNSCQPPKSMAYRAYRAYRLQRACAAVMLPTPSMKTWVRTCARPGRQGILSRSDLCTADVSTRTSRWRDGSGRAAAVATQAARTVFRWPRGSPASKVAGDLYQWSGICGPIASSHQEME